MVKNSSLYFHRTIQSFHVNRLKELKKQKKKMMIGEPTRLSPTVMIPSWDPYDDLTSSGMTSPYSIHNGSGNFNGNASSPSFLDSLTSLHRYLPSNEFARSIAESDSLCDESLSDLPLNAFSCDQFRIYEFKVRRCARGRSHDWTECPYAHPGEKARRRDPRKYHYSGTSCPEFRKGSCRRGDSCEFAHGVFECWLHPARYRTQPCKDGTSCRRRVCFFAHTREQLRVLPQHSPWGNGSGESELGSPIRHHFDSYLSKTAAGGFVSSPTSILASPPVSPPSDSPPMSPSGGQLGIGSFNPVNEITANMHRLQLGKMKIGGGPGGSWGMQMVSGFGSPRSSTLRPGFPGMPTTPIRSHSHPGICPFDLWENTGYSEEEPAMERVESGRELRAKIYAKLSKENSFGREDATAAASSTPDVGWVSDIFN